MKILNLRMICYQMGQVVTQCILWKCGWCNCREESGSWDESNLTQLSTILYSRLDTYSQRQIDMTKLTLLVSTPKHTQHGLYIWGMEVSDHTHASADLTLRAKHPSVPELVIQPHWTIRYLCGNNCGCNMKYHNNVNLTVLPPSLSACYRD
jgi:hypothetical protein